MSPSTMGTDFESFAVFERNSERGDLRTEIHVVSMTQLSADTPELSIALERLGLSLKGAHTSLNPGEVLGT